MFEKGKPVEKKEINRNKKMTYNMDETTTNKVITKCNNSFFTGKLLIIIFNL